MNLDITTMSDIAEETVNFLVRPYLPLGKLVLLNGDPNTGKTHLALAIAAAVTTGNPLPFDVEQNRRAPAHTLFQSMEDGLADTIKPRLMKLGADCDRVHVISEGAYPLKLDDPRIEQAIVQTGAKLAIFDPITTYCNGVSSSGEVRPILTQLAEVAQRTNCTILCIAHLNKRGGKSQYRTLGSIDITAIARSVLTIGKYPDDEEIRVVIHSNHQRFESARNERGLRLSIWRREFRCRSLTYLPQPIVVHPRTDAVLQAPNFHRFSALRPPAYESRPLSYPIRLFRFPSCHLLTSM
jgi:RecA-family ATPase